MILTAHNTHLSASKTTQGQGGTAELCNQIQLCHSCIILSLLYY